MIATTLIGSNLTKRTNQWRTKDSVSNIHVAIYNCTARQRLPLRRNFMECPIISPVLSLLIIHLVIGRRQKAPNFSAFHWSPHGNLVSIGQLSKPHG